jgi:ElaB/YqjD/DUF883 family membrane-anchored ribosome-binding protein
MTESATAEGSVSREKLVEDLKAVVSDAEGLLKATADQTGGKVAEVRGRIEESLKAARARIAEEGKAVVEKAKSAAKSTDEFVHDHPWKAVGIGALVGLLVGFLISRR